MNQKTININRMIMSYLLAVYCMLLPFEEVLVFSFGSLLKVFGLVLIAISFVFMAANRFKLQIEYIWLLVWLIVNAVSVAWSSSFDWWLYFIQIYAGQVLFVVFVVHLPVRYINLRTVAKGLIIGAAFASSVLMLFPGNSSFTSDGRRTIMFLGAKMDPNILGAIFVIAIFCTIYLFRIETGYLYRVVFSVLILLLVAGVFLTGSRGSVIALSVSLLLMAAMYLIKKKRKNTIIYLLIGIAAIILALYFFLPDNLLNNRYSLANILGLNEYDNRMHNRYTIWLSSLKLFIKKPLFGFGCGNFFTAIETVYRQCASHNLIVLEIVEMGIIGSLPLFVFLYKLTVKAKRYCPISLFCMLVAIAIVSLTLDSLPYKYFWLTLMIIGISAKQERERQRMLDD